MPPLQKISSVVDLEDASSLPDLKYIRNSRVENGIIIDMAPSQNNPLAEEMEQCTVVPELKKFDNKKPSQVKIGIIGCGVAGITTARVLKSRGFSNLTIFEAGTAISGVWAQGYPNFGIQTPGKFYEFPDKELPAEKDYKSGPAIREYCEEYCEEHGLTELIQLNTKVVSINSKETMNGDKQWIFQVQRRQDSAQDTVVFDLCILATGIYSPNLKFIPTVEGMEHFKGRICHAEESAYENPEEREGKRVLVVGFGKSAQDCAMNAFAETGVPPTLLFRSAHWCLPRKVLGMIPIMWILYSRLGQATLPTRKECGPTEAVFQHIGYLLSWVRWRIVEFVFSMQLGLWGSGRHLRPTRPIEKDFYCGLSAICHPAIFPMMHKGDIQPVMGQIKRIQKGGTIELNDGSEIDADEIVFATGFQKTFDFLPKEMMEKKEHYGFCGYRDMVVPGVPNLVMLGSNTTSFTGMITPGLQAAWLAEHLLGEIELPKDMAAQVEEEKHLRLAQVRDFGSSKAYLIKRNKIDYWDSLLRDMGINTKRKTSFLPPLAALKNLFVPVQPSDYKDIVTGDYRKKRIIEK